MNKSKRIIAAVISVILLVILGAGCSSKNKAGMDNAAPMSMTTAATTAGKSQTNMQFTESDGDYLKGEREVAETKAADTNAAEPGGIRATGYQSTGTSLDILAQRKIIRNANLTLEVDDFYSSYGNLQSMLAGIGFVQESNIRKDYYYHENERRARVSGNITIRVDARHFDYVLNDIKGLGDVIDDRIYSTDVTDQFFDTEGRLKILKIEYDYLEEYMRSLKDPDSIFKTRMRMTELQTEIERLTGTLNKWSDLVELSTIYIQMNEKYPDDVNVKKTYTYWDRLKDSVKNSLTGIVEALGNLLIFLIDIIPTLVILAIIGWIGFKIYRKRKDKNKATSPEVKEE